MSVRGICIALVGLVWVTAAAAQYVRPVDPVPVRPTPAPQVTAPAPTLTPRIPLVVPTAPTIAVPTPPPVAAPASQPRPRKCWCHQQTPAGGWVKTKCAPECCRGNQNDDRC